MKKIILSVLTVSALMSCEKESTTSKNRGEISIENPRCVDQKIEEFKELCNTGTFCTNVKAGFNVKQYTFEGETVYVFSTGTCNHLTTGCVGIPSEVIDSECNVIGHFGGFCGTDGDDIDGSEFTDENFVRTVWKN